MNHRLETSRIGNSAVVEGQSESGFDGQRDKSRRDSGGGGEEFPSSSESSQRGAPSTCYSSHRGPSTARRMLSPAQLSRSCPELVSLPKGVSHVVFPPIAPSPQQS
ncbi:hypothetical protein GE061_016614 [Apolygus lucorum]|uniref:Uncharacterized protein n=1 Tax=Apolygus lucorum TaxID=248454 RepID=A0A8S9XGQ6_APOLU|nr:hypothetical protein GE061_016614 [Apolygus lucorum]